MPPLKTYLTAPASIPARLNATSLLITYRSNDPAAKFECQADAAPGFTPCPAGASYDFGKLVHGRSYALKVRAASGGRVDQAPLAVAFLADLLSGTPPGGAPAAPAPGPTAAAHVPQTISDLPRPDGAGNRALQVGSFYAVLVPPADEVTSYSTSKTTNSLIHSLRLLDSALTSIAAGLACTQSYEKIVPGPAGGSYCDSTPNDDQWATESAIQVPKNHVEVVHLQGAQTYDEKFLVAAFDADADPTEAHLGIGDSCRGAFYTGTSAVPGLNQFYGLETAEASFSWCQVQDNAGRYWWLGTFAAALGGRAAPPGAPRLRVTYAAAADLGLFSGSQFAERAGRLLPAMIQPIAPPSGAR